MDVDPVAEGDDPISCAAAATLVSVAALPPKAR